MTRTSRRPLLTALLSVVVAGCTSAAAPAPPTPDPYVDAPRATAAFQRIASLAGTWKGAFGMGEGPGGTAEVRYRLTAAGTTVEETLFPGTPHEMVTMYHLDNGRLLLTHYCAAGNQPTMAYVPADDGGVLRFDFLRATNMASPGAGHMHEAVMDLSRDGRVVARWTYWENGQPGHAAVIDAQRSE